jgi:hypothetical protein
MRLSRESRKKLLTEKGVLVSRGQAESPKKTFRVSPKPRELYG